jgi:hypothetical protein
MPVFHVILKGAKATEESPEWENGATFLALGFPLLREAVTAF